jgi:hypothetical protein
MVEKAATAIEAREIPRSGVSAVSGDDRICIQRKVQDRFDYSK